jgi:hypothetical protein
MNDNDRVRFLSKVERDPSGCWNWTGRLDDNGYGRFWLNRTNVYAHRASYAFSHGAIESGTVVHHRCANRSCVNPDHLTAISHHENIAEGLSRADLLRRIEKLEAAIQKLMEERHEQ